MTRGTEPDVPFVDRRQRRDGVRVVAAVAAVLASLSILLSAVLFALNADRAEEINEARGANRDLSCATARLIAYVPAVQFEGESRANFLGWLTARRDMLTVVTRERSCSKETRDLLRLRVQQDSEALRSP